MIVLYQKFPKFTNLQSRKPVNIVVLFLFFFPHREPPQWNQLIRRGCGRVPLPLKAKNKNYLTAAAYPTELQAKLSSTATAIQIYCESKEFRNQVMKLIFFCSISRGQKTAHRL